MGVFGNVEKLLVKKGAQTLFCGDSTYKVKVMEFQSFYEIEKLN